MPSFFISYSRKDLGFAEIIRKHLQLLDSGNDVFLDLYKLKAGVKWKEQLLSNIRKNDFFILILSSNSIGSKYVEEEIKCVRQSELKTGLRKLFVIRIDNVPIPDYMSTYQVLNATGNFTIDFYKLIEGINNKTSYYIIRHEISSDKPTGYWVKVFVEAPVYFLKLIEKVEYRFDYEFHNSQYVDAVEEINATRKSINDGFKVEFWTSEPILLFVVLYLKSIKQLTFEHKIPLYL